MVGTATRVRNSRGMPAEKSSFGGRIGATSNVASQLTNATASWLAAITSGMPAAAIAQRLAQP